MSVNRAWSDAQGGAARTRLRCSGTALLPEHSHSPFRPLIELFESVFEFQTDDTPEEKFEKLAAYVEAHYAGLAQVAVPLYAKMLALGLREPYQEPV